ncbi:HupE/UreJ family protein [Deinococcus enclensis]|uniref:Hydrogenase/urease accessory protein HupE n=1 Tax=Deinococcus enclensis TaxID=1049582 RepID=A0ABT9MHR3_9DEIO|nr:HupE/UreJ family protein [Deinococcus enclensis]MDP9766130.1 hydrogenase/urease accessory protein HupE [Deinococcus enclensis]
MRPWRALLACLLLLWGWAGAHEITFSQVDVRLDQGGTQVTVQLPVKALLHEAPSPLPSGTTATTLALASLPTAVQTSLTTLLTARVRLSAGEGPVPLTVTSVKGAVDMVALTLTGPAISGPLNIQANLFPEDTLHKIFVTVRRGEALVGQYALDRQNAAVTLAAPEQPLWNVIATFVREGVRHIFIGPDHILFVLALILLGGRLGRQVKIITAFTVAHSVTLVLATLNIVQLPSRLVESVIALSIVIVGLHNLWRLRQRTPVRQGRDLRVLFAFGFGLVHGFGFASVLSELALPQQALGWALAAFNVGVEVGQVVIVLLAAPLLLALRRYASPRVAQGVLTLGAAGVVVTGSVWLAQRVMSG